MATKKKLLEAAAGSAGGEALNVEQVFSTYLYDGNGASQVINNGIALGNSNAGSSVEFAGGSGTEKQSLSYANNSNYVVGSSSDFTIEFFVFFRKVDDNLAFGLLSSYSAYLTGIYVSSGSLYGYFQTGSAAQTPISTGQVLSVGQFYHVALVRNGTTFTVYLDGTSVGTVTSSSSVYDASQFFSVGSYTNNDEDTLNGFVSNLRYSSTARYTSNFTPPTSNFTNDSDTILLSCQGQTADLSSNSIAVTEVGSSPTLHDNFGPFTGTDGEGGLVWFKVRTTTGNHALFDTERGVTKHLASNATDAEGTQSGGLSAFNTDGFTVGSWGEVNESGQDLASWTFRKAPKFFDVVTYSGTGSAQNINHSLGQSPGMIIIKSTSNAENWQVWHRSVTGNLELDNTAAVNSSSIRITAVSSTDFTLGTFNTSNGSGQTYVAYLFAHNNNDGEFGPDADQDIIKCGSFSHTSGTPTFVDLGFEAGWILVKRTDAADSWWMADNMRGLTVNGINSPWLAANLDSAEGSSDWIGPNAQGFDFNYQTGDWIYIAIRRGPMAVPTSGTDVFFMDVDGNTGDPAFRTTDSVDFSMIKRPSSIEPFRASSRLTGSTFLDTSTTAAEDSSNTNYVYDYNNGFGGWTTLNSGYQAWMWKRAPNYFDVVAYTGNGTAGRTVSHNLGVAPEMVWIKARNQTYEWAVHHKDVGFSNILYLNLANASASNPYFISASSDTDFTTGYSGSTSTYSNQSGTNYIAYLFASVDGVSKVGSYTGNGSSQNIDCGFSSGARFVLIKRSDSSGDWNLYDTERGIVAGNDSRLSLNTTDAEDTSNDRVDAYSSGFTVNYIATGTSDSNISGATYIFYAIA